MPRRARAAVRRHLAFRLAALAGLLALAVLASAPPARPASEGPFEVVLLRNVMVPMRDGVRLATTSGIRRAAAASGRALPGDPRAHALRQGRVEDWAEYVRAPRLRLREPGRARALRLGGPLAANRDDGNDGYDTAKWIGEQPWFEGGIGTVGTSYPGGTQHALALANPPHLAALVPIDAMSNYGRYGIRHNGAFELRFFNWIFHFGFAPSPAAPARRRPRGGRRPGRASATRCADYVRALPLRRGTTPLALAPDYEDWLVEAMRHGDNDAFWRDMGASVVDHLAEYKDVPVYHVGGWYDSWAAQTANLNYVELRRTKKSLQRLIMGPWTHGGQERSFAGEAEFGPEAALDLGAFHRRWFDRWLKGVDNGVDREPPVRIFVMGGGDGHKTPGGPALRGRALARRERVAAGPRDGHALLPARRRPPVPRAARAAAPTRYLFDPQRPGADDRAATSRRRTASCRGAPWTSCAAPRSWAATDRRPLARAQRRARVPDAAPRRGHGGDGPAGGEAVDQLVGARTPTSRPSWSTCSPPSRDFPAGVDLNVGDSIVRARFREGLDHEADAHAARPRLSGHHRALPDVARLREGPPHPPGHLEQQLPALRREPEHGRAAERQPAVARRRTRSTTTRSRRRTSCCPSSPRPADGGGSADGQGYAEARPPHRGCPPTLQSAQRHEAPCHSPRALGCPTSRSKRSSGPEAWARSTARATRSCAAWWPSRSFPRPSPRTRSGSIASSERPACSRPSPTASGDPARPLRGRRRSLSRHGARGGKTLAERIDEVPCPSRTPCPSSSSRPKASKRRTGRASFIAT